MQPRNDSSAIHEPSVDYPLPGGSGRGDAPVLTCPNCGAGLSQRSCKLVCPNRECGYYLSCSDYL